MIDLNIFLGLVLILLYSLFCCNNFYNPYIKNYYDNGNLMSTKTVTAKITVVNTNSYGDKRVSFYVNEQYIGGCTIVSTNPYGLPGNVSKTITIK